MESKIFCCLQVIDKYDFLFFIVIAGHFSFYDSCRQLSAVFFVFVFTEVLYCSMKSPMWIPPQ